MAETWDHAVAEHRASTRQRLFGAAMAVLAEHGMAGATMTAIAERAGVSRPTLYKYFPDVDHLVAALAREEFASFRDELDRTIDPDSPAVEQLEHLVVAHLRYFAADRARMGDGSLEAGMSPVVRAAVEEELVEHHARLVGILTAGVADGSLRPDLDPDLAAELVQHVLGGMRHTVRRRDGDPLELAPPVIRMVLTGLATNNFRP